MKWALVFLPEAKNDLKCLAGNQRIFIAKTLEKVRQNPLPDYEGGYGKPLGNKGSKNLTGFLKIKLKNAGLRVVYQLKKTDTEMLVIVIGARADEEVYEIASNRISKYDL